MDCCAHEGPDGGDARFEVKQRVTATLAPVHEPAFSAYADYRPWRAGGLGNIERTFATVG